MFFGNGIRLGRIGGITISLDYSWFIIFALFIFLLATGYYPRVAPHVAVGWYYGAATFTSLLFFGSVLAHELSHAVVARRLGIPINAITLFILGGVAQMEDEPNTAWDEFRMAIAGPAMSLVLGFLFLGLAEISIGKTLLFVSLFYLGLINIILAVFNLLPGYPMDGGRVFRALIWGITHNLRRATQVASITGQAFGWIFVFLGIGSIFLPVLRTFSSIWMALIGWFLITAARNSYQQIIVREALREIPVSDVMTPRVEAVPQGVTVERLVTDYLLRESASVLPVEHNGDMVGIVSVDDVSGVPRDEWATRLVGEIMRPLGEEAMVHPQDDAWNAANRMAHDNSDRVLVTEDGHVEGVVTRGAIARWLQTHLKLAPGGAPA